jgi:hypothetical protein
MRRARSENASTKSAPISGFFLPIKRGAFYVMDKAYIDFARLYRMHCPAAFFGRFSRSDQSAGGGSVPGLDA